MSFSKFLSSTNRTDIATAIAILFHAIGLIGLLFASDTAFRYTTPLNQLLMFGLLLYTMPKQTCRIWLFIVISFITGMAVEMIGTNTGFLFGEYQYGDVLGPSINHVPWIIGINWVLVIYCCGSTMKLILQKWGASIGLSDRMKWLSLVVDGAMLAVLFDWIMEPVAIQLGYWSWSGAIPFFNYLCWFLISIPLLMLFPNRESASINKFAFHLFLIQTFFFLLLRTFL
ncbi:MAG: carotenoid biosynthesis protein [Ferruginibacter sp.]